jgi:hypothetical protein
MLIRRIRNLWSIWAKELRITRAAKLSLRRSKLLIRLKTVTSSQDKVKSTNRKLSRRKKRPTLLIVTRKRTNISRLMTTLKKSTLAKDKRVRISMVNCREVLIEILEFIRKRVFSHSKEILKSLIMMNLMKKHTMRNIIMIHITRNTMIFIMIHTMMNTTRNIMIPTTRNTTRNQTKPM